MRSGGDPSPDLDTMVRQYGPVFAFYFGVDEDVVATSWTVERFYRYKNFVDAREKGGSRHGQ